MTYNPYDSVKGTVKPQWANQALATDGENPMQFLTLTDRRFPHADHKMNAPSRRNLKNLDPYQGPSDVRELTTEVIKTLLRPRDWTPPARGELFFLEVPDIMRIFEHSESIFKKEPTLLRLKAPMKVFGDIHGQFADMLRLFDKYGMPTVSGDLALTDYLFLGDYVDRGSHSIETIILLLCLKLQRPRNIFLIRGNHEVATMNNNYGFRLECMEKFGSFDGNQVWKRINEMFNWMPLGAIIDRKVLCMHGGIGPNMTTLGQIDQIQRPIRAYFHDTAPVMATVNEILWSDPAEDDSIVGYQDSERGPRLLKFGADRVAEFCAVNGIELIIRSHQCVMDGFERFAGGRLVTVFSATNYCGQARNNGAIIQLGRKLEVIVRTIQPKADDEEFWDAITNEQNPPSPMNSPRRSQAEGDGDSSDEDEDEDEEEGEDASDEEDESSDEEDDRDEVMIDRGAVGGRRSPAQPGLPRSQPASNLIPRVPFVPKTAGLPAIPPPVDAAAAEVRQIGRFAVTAEGGEAQAPAAGTSPIASKGKLPPLKS